MQNFSQYISNFEKNGIFVYGFDDGGNATFNSGSTKFNENYISLPLINYSYDNTKIKSFYDLTFKEFVSTTENVSSKNVTSTEITQLSEENITLKSKLESLTQTSDANITDAERLAIKQIILDLRIQLKQGISVRDFSTVFPYIPITKNNK
jgi:hypothetical protein